MAKATRDKIDAMSKGVELNQWKERSKKIKELADDVIKAAGALEGLGANLIVTGDKEKAELGCLLEVLGEYVRETGWELWYLIPEDAGKEEAA